MVTRCAADLFTIGHSNHPIERFLDLLRRHGIGAVADVRSRPYSRFVPHFSKERLQRIIAEEGIDYLYLGQELGGRPRRGDPAFAASDYGSRLGQPEFREGIARLLEAARRQRVVLLCRERDPLDCHRLHLICRYAAPLVGRIEHILADGAVEAQDATERRVLARAAPDELPLFGRDDALAQAYEQWWRKAR